MFALVTGGGGFLGRSIVEQLRARGDRVRSFARGVYPELEQIGVEVVRGDILDTKAMRAACEGVDTVFHTAAFAGIHCDGKPFFNINVIGTLQVLQAATEQGVPRFVYTSSPSVVFAGKNQKNIDESAPYPEHWNSHYSHSKAVAEMFVLNSNGRQFEKPSDRGTELSTCALRPHLIWGPRDQHLIPRLFDRARNGKLVKIGSGKNLIDHIYVENAAKAHLQAADALVPDGNVAGNAYFLSQGEPVNCWEWIDQLLALEGLPPVKKRISLPFAWLIGAVLEGTYSLLRRKDEPRLTRFLAQQLGRSHYYNISAAKRDFGYAPEISTEEGMRRLKEYLDRPPNVEPNGADLGGEKTAPTQRTGFARKTGC